MQRGTGYPPYAQTMVPFVTTTDFIIAVREGVGSTREFSRTVKYTDELSSGKRLLCTLEKLELEGVWWLQPGVVSAIQARVSQRLRCAGDGSKYESHICRLLPGIGCDIWHL